MIIALAFYSPWLNSAKVVEVKGRSVCSVIDISDEIKSWQIAVVITNYIIIIITIVLLVILYSIIVIKLKLQTRPGEQSNNAEKKRAKRNRKVLRMACAIVLAFSLCCVPMLTLGFMSLFPKIMSSCGVPIFVFIAIFMYHVNCAVNPIICLIFSSNYRQGLKRLEMLRTTNVNVHYIKTTTMQNVVPIHSNITVKFDSSIKERKKE